jgi:hypothetical protein
MRKNKKVLKFGKFKIANLQVSGVVGGTNSNPCGVTTTVPPGSHQPESNIGENTCGISELYYPGDCTRGKILTNENAENCQG